ncbi:MAG: sigma-70 family RNA polymerase sigma factor, partial [Chloroflexota bacterium]|nr:sigma-70 family RNA polymerase sigma factor [Chloroflexota bacterium]
MKSRLRETLLPGSDDQDEVGVADTTPVAVPQLVDHLFRQQAGRVVATLTRIFGQQHVGLAEDVVQETLIKALCQWPYHGIPDNPEAWILQVARRNALDVVRRERTLREKQEIIAQELESFITVSQMDVASLDHQIQDDQLLMLFTCCHPALSHESQVALTLKTLGGLGVGELARAFLVPEPTIAQRLVRAKRTLRARASLDELQPADVAARLDAALDVLYLLFNEGYSAHQGEDLIRHE